MSITSHIRRSLIVLPFAVFSAACSSKTKMPDDNHPVSTDTLVSAPGAAATAMPQDTGMSAMTGDADHDFLRMMSDHHKGMIAMAHPTIDSKENLSVKDEARRLDKAQDGELDTMAAMLKTRFNDAYSPKVSAENQRMVDALAGKTGADYSKTFLQNTISHHQAAISMIDAYLPKAKDAGLKKMAMKMKSDQTKEISEFKKKLSVM